jgi:hypothetical protein
MMSEYSLNLRLSRLGNINDMVIKPTITHNKLQSSLRFIKYIKSIDEEGFILMLQTLKENQEYLELRTKSNGNCHDHTLY